MKLLQLRCSIILTTVAMILPMRLGYAQSSAKVHHKAPAAPASTPAFQAKNYLGVYLGYKSIHAKEGLFIGRQISPRFMVSAHIGLPFSPDIYGSNAAVLVEESTETPPELMTISTYQTITVLSGRVQFFPRALTTYPYPLMDGLYFYQTLDVTKHNINFKTTIGSSPNSTGDFHVIGGATTGGIGYYFMPTAHIFVDFSYLLGVFYSFIKSYGFSGDNLSSKLRTAIFDNNRVFNPFMLRPPPYFLSQLSVSVGYIF